MADDWRWTERAGTPRARMTLEEELAIIAVGWASANGRDRPTGADYGIAERIRAAYRSRGAVLAWGGQGNDTR